MRSLVWPVAVLAGGAAWMVSEHGLATALKVIAAGAVLWAISEAGRAIGARIRGG